MFDLQPGLATVLQATQDTDTTRYLHAPRGIHAQQDASDNWTWMLQDGLGSVRSVVDDSLSVLESRLYEPYGTPFGVSGSSQTVYGFTGEPTDENELVYLRARYYAPNLGVFTRQDLVENLNRYCYTNGNPTNWVDHDGMQTDLPPSPGLEQSIGDALVPIAQFWNYHFVDSSWSQGVRGIANDVSIAPRLFYENPTIAWQALQQLLSGCNNNVLQAGTEITALLRIPVVGKAVIIGGVAVAGILGLSTLAGHVARELDPVWYSWLHPLENPYNTPQPPVDPVINFPEATPTQRRANTMRVQLQYARNGVNNDIASEALTDSTGNGVTTNQVIAALQRLRQNRAIANSEQKAADSALQDAINWTLNRPPNGVSNQNYSWDFPFNKQNTRNTKHFDIENIIGTNLRM